VGPGGKAVRDAAELARIKALAIPPAYTDVWISPDPRGHIQATGRDARGRKQYRYHKKWRDVRDETKFDRMIGFAKALPRIRAGMARDLALPGLPREKVLATVVALLEETAIRVGNEEYARDNASYGLTTMLEEHVRVRGEVLRFRFRGKSGKDHDIAVRDKRLAKIVKACLGLPGEELFGYLDDDGERHAIASQDVNAYLRELAGDDFTAKDFRTWEATLGCALALAASRAETAGERKLAVTLAIKTVADRLGNTPAVCKKSYIHPAVIDEFIAVGAIELVERKVAKAEHHGLSAIEHAVLAYVERLITRDEKAHLSELLARSVQEGANRQRSRAAKSRTTASPTPVRSRRTSTRRAAPRGSGG
jgi:DNA topoisomerase-1